MLHSQVYSGESQAQGLNNLTWVLCCKCLHGGDKCDGYPEHCL